MKNLGHNSNKNNELRNNAPISIHSPSFTKKNNNNTNDNLSNNLGKLYQNYTQFSKIFPQYYSSLYKKNSYSIRNNYALVEIVDKKCNKKCEIKENKTKQNNETKFYKSKRVIKPYIIENVSNKRNNHQSDLTNPNFSSNLKKRVNVDSYYNMSINESVITKYNNQIQKFYKINPKTNKCIEENKKKENNQTTINQTGEIKFNEEDANIKVNKRNNYSFKSVNLSKAKTKINHSNVTSQNVSNRLVQNLINQNNKKQEKIINNIKNVSYRTNTNLVNKIIESKKSEISKEIINSGITEKNITVNRNYFFLGNKNKTEHFDSEDKNNLLYEENKISKESYANNKLKIFTDDNNNKIKLNKSVFNSQKNEKCLILNTEPAQINIDKEKVTEKTNNNGQIKKLENKKKTKKYKKRYTSKYKSEDKNNINNINNINDINTNKTNDTENNKNDSVFNTNNNILNDNNDKQNKNNTVINDNNDNIIRSTIRKIEVPKINLKLANNTNSNRNISPTNYNINILSNDKTNIINANIIDTNDTNETTLTTKQKNNSVFPLKINNSTSNLQKRETIINKNHNMVLISIKSFSKKRKSEERKKQNYDQSNKHHITSLSSKNNIIRKDITSSQNNKSKFNNTSTQNNINNISTKNNILTRNNLSNIDDNNSIKTRIFSNGKYTGNLVNDKKEGHGIMEYVNGSKYEGEWKNDKKHGKGVYISSNFNKNNGMAGLKYEGDFNDDKMEGWGIGIYTNGDRYEGEWKDNKQYGRGVVYYLNGGKYDGEWVKGKFNGFGSYYLRNGEKYEGKFLNSKYHGYGKYYLSNGEILEGIFNNDHPTGNTIMHKTDGTIDRRNFVGYL